MKKELVKKALVDAKELLVTKGWHQDGNAIDSRGLACDPKSPHAVSFCGRGALLAVYDANDYEVYDEVYDTAVTALCKAADTTRFIFFNDYPGRTKEEVLAVFDKAIASL